MIQEFRKNICRFRNIYEFSGISEIFWEISKNFGVSRVLGKFQEF
jgi:hypothetical protein